MSRSFEDIAARLFSAETIESAREVFSSMNPDEKANFLAFKDPQKSQKGFLHKAAFAGKALAVYALLEAGADVRAVNSNGATAIHHATNAKVLDALLEKIPDQERLAFVQAKDNNGLTAMHYARNAEIVYALLAIIPEQARLGFVKATDNNGNNALHAASLRGDLSTVHALLNAGADIMAVSNDERTALYYAKTSEIVGVLLARVTAQHRSAFIQATNKKGDTALHAASARGDLSAVQALLRAGSDVRAVNNNGETALHVFLNNCGDKDSCAVAEVLDEFLARNANVLAMDKGGNTPLGIATERRNSEIQESSVFSSDAGIFSTILQRFNQHLKDVFPARALPEVAQAAPSAASSAPAAASFHRQTREQSAASAAVASATMGGSGSAFTRIAPVSSSASARAEQQRRGGKRKEPSAAAPGRT